MDNFYFKLAEFENLLKEEFDNLLKLSEEEKLARVNKILSQINKSISSPLFEQYRIKNSNNYWFNYICFSVEHIKCDDSYYIDIAIE